MSDSVNDADFLLQESNVQAVDLLLGAVVTMKENINFCRCQLMDGLCKLIEALRMVGHFNVRSQAELIVRVSAGKGGELLPS
jgi:hypothetical protein